MQKQIKRDHVNFDGMYNYLNFLVKSMFILNFNVFIDENEIHNDPNLHPEEQDELELPDSKIFFLIMLKILSAF